MNYWNLILILFFFGCQNLQKPEKPKDLIPEDKMVSILTEAYLANASQSVRNQAVFAEAIDLDSIIYTKFNIDSIQFKKSNDYYSFDFNTYLDMLKKVENNLMQYEKRIDSLREVQIQKQDEIEQERQAIRENRTSEENE